MDYCHLPSTIVASSGNQWREYFFDAIGWLSLVSPSKSCAAKARSSIPRLSLFMALHQKRSFFASRTRLGVPFFRKYEILARTVISKYTNGPYFNCLICRRIGTKNEQKGGDYHHHKLQKANQPCRSFATGPTFVITIAHAIVCASNVYNVQCLCHCSHSRSQQGKTIEI
jgi:hypothetical protein